MNTDTKMKRVVHAKPIHPPITIKHAFSKSRTSSLSSLTIKLKRSSSLAEIRIMVIKVLAAKVKERTLSPTQIIYLKEDRFSQIKRLEV